jgi:23S rRNA (pseudouridine1915-N3)-methyltransferase
LSANESGRQVKIKFIATGKTNTGYLREAISVYENRLKHYTPFELICIPDVKNAGSLSESQLKDREGKSILAQLNFGDELILLDEKGEMCSSSEFSLLLSRKINASVRCIAFVAGGAYGFRTKFMPKRRR